jgi:hypothetical protein
MRIELDMRGRIKDAFDPFLIFPEKALDRRRSCFGRSYGERKFHFGQWHCSMQNGMKAQHELDECRGQLTEDAAYLIYRN